MKKVVSLLSAVALMSLGSVSAANADQLSPDGDYRISGTLDLYQLIPGVNCQIDADLSVSGGVGTVSNIVFSPGSTSLCISPIGSLTSTWQVLGVDEATNLISIDVDVNAFAGRCVGLLYAHIELSPNEIQFGPSIDSGSPVPGYLYDEWSTPRDCVVAQSLSITPVWPTAGPLDVIP